MPLHTVISVLTVENKNYNTDAKTNIITKVAVIELITIKIKDKKRTLFIHLKLSKISNNNSNNKKIKTCIYTPLYEYNYKFLPDLQATGPTTFPANLPMFL